MLQKNKLHQALAMQEILVNGVIALLVLLFMRLFQNKKELNQLDLQHILNSKNIGDLITLNQCVGFWSPRSFRSTHSGAVDIAEHSLHIRHCKDNRLC